MSRLRMFAVLQYVKCVCSNWVFMSYTDVFLTPCSLGFRVNTISREINWRPS